MAASQETTELPVRSAGGGKPSEATPSIDVKPSTTVHQQLRHIFQNLTKNELFQDDLKVTDEEAFMSYMRSSASSALSPPGVRDLNYPISNYFISSSHNTYLSGNQLFGEATTEAYTNVLKRGCRCLEIDVWDGEEFDTSASGTDEEHPNDGSGRPRSNSKTSRWQRLKKKAGNRAIEVRRTPGSSPSRRHHLTPTASGHAPDGAMASPPNDPGRLSPTPSLTATEKAEPRVLHGYTLTQSVPFRSVCAAIRDSAFDASDLPIIVSLEVHASLEQQNTMVEIMRETWGDHLVDITEDAENQINSLPSPGSLSRKILIKVKWSPDNRTGESNNPLDHMTTASTDDGTETSEGHSSAAQQKKASKVLTALSELGIYTRAYTFKHFDQPEASIPTHVFSLSEGKVHEMHASPEHGPALFDHNKNFLMRVFPKGTRIRSTNVDPSFHWQQGAQMVALNWQRLDRGMMLNEGMFAGYDGWVLKPEGYRSFRPEAKDNESAQQVAKPASSKKHLLDLKIQLLSAQDLPLPLGKDVSHRYKMKPYVKVQLHTDTHGPPGQGKTSRSSKVQSEALGEDEDEKKNKRRSKTNRSDSPNFDGETLSWLSVPDVVEELSFVRITVKDDRSLAVDELSSWACIRLDRLKSGLRFIHLFDAKGMPSPGAILVRIIKNLS